MANRETKHERFVRLAEARTEKALRAIRLICNLSNKATYDFSDSDIRKILKALDDEIKVTSDKFSRSRSKQRQGFTLESGKGNS